MCNCISRILNITYANTDLIRRLRNAGFILQQGQGRGSHRVYDHPHGQTVTIPGHDNNNAPHYLIAQVRDAIEAAGGTWKC